MDEARVARLLGGLFIALRYGLTDDGRRVVDETLSGFANSENRVRHEIDRFVDRKVAELKSGQCGSLPAEVLKQTLTRGDSCMCRAALRLLHE